MPSQKPNTTENPPPDWKMEFEKYWLPVRDKAIGFYHDHENLCSAKTLGSVAGGALLLTWLGSGVYIIDQGNRGVVTRFGAYTETTKPGPHWHWPAPIEKVTRVNVEQQRFIELGYRDSSRYSKSTSNSSLPQESLMLTRDENIVNVRLAVQYQINDAKNYLFNVKDNEETLKQLTESVERGVIGRNDMDFILTEGRSQIVNEIKAEIQKAMDDYKAGVVIASVNLQDAQPPEEVQNSFADAIRAREDKQRLINEAQAYSNEIIPKARGAAARLIQEAEAYEAQKVAQAKGDTERFEQLLAEYEKAPAITRKRLYLEATEKLYSSANKVLVDSPQGASPAFYLPLQQSAAHPAAAQPEVAAPAAPAHNVTERNAGNNNGKSELRPSRSKP